MSEAATVEAPARVATISPEIEAIRAKLREGVAPVPIFAVAVDRTERTVFKWIADGLPVIYIGRTPFVQIEPGRDWLRSRRRRRAQPDVPKRGRPRKTA
jgi:hypothetical protein